FLKRFLTRADAGLADGVRQLWRAWNLNATASVVPDLPDANAWQRHCESWRAELLLQPDLVSQMIGFVAETG
ncbi:MAG: elongation factor P maturation arginine rhamnosyltransferase EarP, partial [Burkholderiaceae bacterium]